MKTRYLHLLLAIVSMLFAACTIEESIVEDIADGNSIEAIRVSAPDFIWSDDITKTTVQIDDEGAKFSWAATDTIGIFPNTGFQVAFPMASGAGAKTAEFNGGGWALKPSSLYAAYYPFQYNNRQINKIAASYVGQMQKGNGNTGHIGKYDYMAASATIPEDGNVTFNFRHLGALAQWKLKVPGSGEFTSLTITAKEPLFIRNGYIDLSKPTPIIDAAEKHRSLSIELSDIATSAAGEEITVYMMLPPADLSGKTLTLALANDKGEVAEAEITGKNLEAGNAYSFEAQLGDFSEAVLQIADKRGKVIGAEGGTVDLTYLSNLDCIAVIPSEAQGWISQTSTKAAIERKLSFEIAENTDVKNRRATITIKGIRNNLAVEYVILQGGKNSYAITQDSCNIPAGIITPQYPAIDSDHGVANLFDNNENTYYEVAKKSFFIEWEGTYQIPMNELQLGLVAGTSRIHWFHMEVSSDGNSWNSLGWGVGFGLSDHSYLSTHECSLRSQYVRLVIESNQGASSTRISEYHLTEDTKADNDITSLSELISRGISFSQADDTPMGKHYSNKHVTTEDDKAWLANPANEPALLQSASGYTLREYEVNLYPFGNPVPADINQHGVGDCSALAVFAEMAYLFPDFIKSIITDNQDGTYTVAMYDPQGKPVNVSVQSTFLGDNNGIGATSGKDGKANWATIMEKAIMKWNYIYKVNPDIAGIGSEHVAPLFTGEGNSFAIAPNSLLAKQLGQAVEIALQNRMIVIGGFNKAGLAPGGEGPQTVTAHAYSFMYSNVQEALFAMRNPWGNSPGGSEGDDGIMNVLDDGSIPPTIDLRIIYPGAAEKYAVKDLGPYIPPKY